MIVNHPLTSSIVGFTSLSFTASHTPNPQPGFNLSFDTQSLTLSKKKKKKKNRISVLHHFVLRVTYIRVTPRLRYVYFETSDFSLSHFLTF